MEISLAKILSAIAVIGIRVSGLMLFAPFFGDTAVPPRIKAMLVIAFTVLLYPVYASRVPVMAISNWPITVAGELVIGAAMGLATQLVFDAAQMAGQVLSVQIGYSLINILDPQTQVDTTVVSVFHQLIALLIFISLDVHHWILRAVANSFAYLPSGTLNLNANFTTSLLNGAVTVLVTGIQIAAPVLAATLVADVVLGLLGKSAPQMPLMVLGPPLKSVLGLLILAGALRYWPRLFEQHFARSIAFAEQLLHLAH